MRPYEGTTLWNPSRVRNFLVKLNMKPTNFQENLVLLAGKADMSVEQFLKANPITLGNKWFGDEQIVRRLLGNKNYFSMHNALAMEERFGPKPVEQSELEKQADHLHVSLSVLGTNITMLQRELEEHREELEHYRAAFALCELRH